MCLIVGTEVGIDTGFVGAPGGEWVRAGMFEGNAQPTHPCGERLLAGRLGKHAQAQGTGTAVRALILGDVGGAERDGAIGIGQNLEALARNRHSISFCARTAMIY